MKLTSRRSALFSVAMIPAVALCRQARNGLDIAWETLEEFGCINAAIVATPATTMEGLYVKARAGCWALLGDFDSADQSASGARMAFSMMRDLIRLHAPHLENPGALQRLVKEIEEGAKNNSATQKFVGT